MFETDLEIREILRDDTETSPARGIIQARNGRAWSMNGKIVIRVSYRLWDVNSNQKKNIMIVI